MTKLFSTVLNQGKQTIPQMLYCYTHTKLPPIYWSTQVYRCLVFKKAKHSRPLMKKINQSFMLNSVDYVHLNCNKKNACERDKSGNEGEVTIILMRFVSFSFKWVFWPNNCHIKGGSYHHLISNNRISYIWFHARKKKKKKMATIRSSKFPGVFLILFSQMHTKYNSDIDT